jgi:competence ComEA-like helix-hairpin-helix protein
MSIRLAAPIAAIVVLGLGLPLGVSMAAVQPETAPAPPAAFAKVCVRCHASDKVVEGRRYAAQWDQVIEQMIARGAIGSDEEFDIIADYLVAQYGRVAINTAPAEEIAQVLHLEQSAADTIVQYRRAHGPFADFDALAAVPEVPLAALEKLRDAIVF